MTSTTYHNEETWMPLSQASRKWEDASPASPQSPTRHTSGVAPEITNGEGLQPEAPVLAKEHIWGVRDDWGTRAGAWGQGAKVYEKL